jgi:hypothetical protein
MHMTELQRSVLAISTALVLLLCVLIIKTTDRHGEKVRVAEKDLRFDASSACESAKQLATRFPERGTGTEGAGDAADWLESEMNALGLQAEQQEFEVWIAGKRVTGRNVIGIDKGRQDEAIALIAHYDIPFHVREGAMDNASGVGALLELARLFSEKKQTKTLVFIASDGEEWGMLGARHFVDTFPQPDRIRASISFDCVPLENQNELSLHGEGQFRGQAPMWLRMLAEDCVAQVGGTPSSDINSAHYISQAVNISSTDQGPFVRAGIPGINLGGSASNSSLARKIYHTPQDTSENLRPELFDIYGQAAELMVYTLDELDYSTDNNYYYLRTSKRTSVSRRELRVFHILLFLPLLMMTSVQYYNLRMRERFIREALGELINILLFILPWVFALVALHLLVWKNVIPRYELYPATPLDSFLRMPNWMALGVLVTVFLIAWAAIVLLRQRVSFLQTPDFAVSKAVCLDVLLTLSIITLFLNGFAASLFLGPAALLWGWIEAGRRPTRLAFNTFLALAASVPLVLLVAAFSGKLQLGWYVGWYLILGAGYGLFSPFAVLIAAGAGTVGVRLLQRSFVEEIPVVEPEMESE